MLHLFTLSVIFYKTVKHFIKKRYELKQNVSSFHLLEKIQKFMFIILLHTLSVYLVCFEPPASNQIAITHINYLKNHKITIAKSFPGINRIIYLYNTIPIIYLSLNIDMILVAMEETTIPINENYGGQVSIVPATEESNGYYLIFGNKKLCGNGPNSSVYACLYELMYPREAIWYIKRGSHGYNIHRGNMCITRIESIITFKSKEEWPVQLRRCTLSNMNQMFFFDHMDNFFM